MADEAKTPTIDEVDDAMDVLEMLGRYHAIEEDMPNDHIIHGWCVMHNQALDTLRAYVESTS